MLSLIDRYIARMFLVNFVGGLLVFLTLFITVDAMSTAVKYGVSMDVIIRYYTFLSPSILYQLVPVACLVGTVFTLSSLNRSSEMIALFSVGYSLARLSLPILLLVSLFSLLNFVASDRLLPYFNQQKNYVYFVEMKNKPHLYSTVKTGKIWYRTHNVLFNIQSLNPEKNHAQGLTMYYFSDEWDLLQMISAKDVDMQEGLWKLKEGSVVLFVDDFPVAKPYTTKSVVVGPEVKDLHKTAQTSDVLGVGDLRKFIEKNRAAGMDTTGYEVDYHAKFGFAFAAFVMSLIGIPFSVGGARSSGLMVNAGLCLGVAFVYWALYSSGLTLGKHAYVPPFVAAWTPNVLMTVMSFFLLLRLKK